MLQTIFDQNHLIENDVEDRHLRYQQVVERAL